MTSHWSLILFTLLNLYSVFTMPLPKLDTNEDDRKYAEDYLQRFYRFETNVSRKKRDTGGNNFQEKLKEMQRFFRLPVTGKLNSETLKVMKKPRCGLSDSEKYGLHQRWKNSTLSFRILKYTSKLKSKLVNQVIKKAFKIWSDVVSLKFVRRQHKEADILISFVSGEHNDNNPFDGPGGFLAHAFQPGRGIGGDIHFDEDEAWSLGHSSYNLLFVAVHELGHALGLFHSSDFESIMFPFYSELNELILSHDDVEKIQSLYGASKQFNPELIRPKSPHKCDKNLSFDAAIVLHNEMLFFKDRYVWRRHPQMNEVEMYSSRSFWPNIPLTIDAAYENPELSSILFFKGTKYWTIRNSDNGRVEPKNIKDFGFPQSVKKIDAVMHIKDTEETLFFVEDKYWRYNEIKGEMIAGYPREVIEHWPEVSGRVDAAFDYKGTIFLFSGPIQYEYDCENKRINRIQSVNSWLGCHQINS